MKRVALVAGSQSDVPLLAECRKHLEFFGIPYDEFVLSAHRNPEETADFARSAEQAGYGVLIAAAGMAAALPGVLAAHTILPVIGVPVPSSDLHGLDSLLSIAQMPSGVPVATMAIGKAGSANAGVLAAQILALEEPTLREKLYEFKQMGCKIPKEPLPFERPG
jgi:5-(carboxyamino)imidazole ribonucleotide mutase